MAKSTKRDSFTKCVIDTDDGTITEYLKDQTYVHKIEDVLEKWNGVEDVSITFATDEEIIPTGEE